MTKSQQNFIFSSLVSRSHTLSQRKGLVSQGEFLGPAHALAIVNLTMFGKNLLQTCHCENKLVVSTTEWLPWLQTNWRDSGYAWFALVLETNCKKKKPQGAAAQFILQPQCTNNPQPSEHL